MKSLSGAPLTPVSCCEQPECKISRSDLLRCADCKVVYYCSRAHQLARRPLHKSICKTIKRDTALLEKEKEKVEADNNPIFTGGGNAFVQNVGHFWGLVGTRDYLRQRYTLTDSLIDSNTYTGVEAALDHILDILRLNRSDNMGLRTFVPALYLRLGRDQECYDFIRWWYTSGHGYDDTNDTCEPLLSIKGADVFEPLTELKSSQYVLHLSHLVSLTLLKIRILLDLRNLRASEALAETKLPNEISDMIRQRLVSTAVAGRKDIFNQPDHSGNIRLLETQIDELVEEVHKENHHMWKSINDPRKEDLNAMPHYYRCGTESEMQVTLRQCYQSWVETPGALEELRTRT